MPEGPPKPPCLASHLATALGVACCVTAWASAEETELLPLPAWTEQDATLLQQAPYSIPLGGFLWPDGFDADSLLPHESLPSRTPSSDLFDPTLEQRKPSPGRSDGFLLFIPKPPKLPPATNPQTTVTPPHDLVEVGADFLRECESLEPDAWLLDPHTLLPETQSEDLRRLLAYHAGEASTFAHFLLLDSNEQLPASVELSRLARGRLVQDHACLAVYPVAEPWRARIFMTREIVDSIPADYLRGILQACVQDAMQASDPVEQLQQFATQLSIRLIWMERAHPGIFATADETAAAAPKPASTLAEVSRLPANPTVFTPSVIRWRAISIIGSGVLAGALLVALLCRALIRWHRRRMRNSVWLLPDVEIQPRLGAPHCGQGGVWIRFG